MSVPTVNSSLLEAGLIDLPPLSEEIRAVDALCRHALEADYPGLANQIPELPDDPRRWFELLSGIHGGGRGARLLARWSDEAHRLGGWPRGSVERFGILQACLVALSLLSSRQIHDSLNRQFCSTFRRVAARAQGWGAYFAYDNDAFEELARIVTLRRFHAGQVSFDIMPLPRSWLLKVHPLALPGVVGEILGGMGGSGRIVMPHLNYWRANPMMLLKKENDRAHWRIAMSMERDPGIKGLISASWLYSVEVGRASPHIGWLRDFYRDNGAYLVDMEVAHVRAGYLVGSETRRHLHEAGKFRPRETAVLWSRAKMLAWAHRYAEDRAVPRSPSRPGGKTRNRLEPNWQASANDTVSSGQITIINCSPFLRRAPRRYIVTVFLIPSIIIAITVGAVFGYWAVVPATALGVIGIWLFQYFFLQ
jgi:hypothetical protein